MRIALLPPPLSRFFAHLLVWCPREVKSLRLCSSLGSATNNPLRIVQCGDEKLGNGTQFPANHTRKSQEHPQWYSLCTGGGGHFEPFWHVPSGGCVGTITRQRGNRKGRGLHRATFRTLEYFEYQSLWQAQCPR